MRTTATRHEHDTTPAAVLFMAFELSEKTWKLGFSIGHGRNEQGRIVHRDLHAFGNRSLRATVIGVVDADHIGQAERIETALFEELCQLYPGGKLGIFELASITAYP